MIEIYMKGAEVPPLEALFDRRDILRRANRIFWDRPRAKALRAKARETERPDIDLLRH